MVNVRQHNTHVADSNAFTLAPTEKGDAGDARDVSMGFGKCE